MASQLVRDGKRIDVVLAAGEWQGAAIMNYMKLQEIEESRILCQTLAMSDEEAEIDA